MLHADFVFTFHSFEYFSLSNPVTGMDDEDFYKLLAKYKFTIAMENGVCPDYITEKFWRPFVVGSVPIVFGSPTLKVYQYTIIERR